MSRLTIDDIIRCDCCNKIRNDSRYRKEYQNVLCRECYKKYKATAKPKVWDKVDRTGRKAYVNIRGEVVRVIDF